MADFRKVVIALAVVALMTGFASTANAQAFACTASAAVPPLLRAEGLTELTGDIVLNCTGGTAPTAGGVIGVAANTGVANVAVFLGNTTVTSRLLDSSNTSEAVLLIDDPNTTANPTPISVAATPLAGCGLANCTVGGANPNAFRGIVSGNSVTFIGIPIVPPGSTGSRIFRITNVRANATTVGAGPGGTPGQVQAYVSISGSTSIPLNNPTQVIGFVQNGLTVVLRNAANDGTTSGRSFAQCADNTGKSIRAHLRFTENFATAFKLRGDTTQTVPGAVYNTESGLVIPGTTQVGALGTAATLGLADFGTRLRATFANIPAGTDVYVSTRNVGYAATKGADLVISETGAFVAAVPVDTYATLYGVVKVVSGGGSGVAVWEVTGNSNLTTDSYDFPIFIRAASYAPAVGVQGTVAGSFAPAPPAISASDGAKASFSLPIPRFIDTGTPKNLINFYVCRTNILFPFVTNQATFDTGMAIANTTVDPFGTSSQTGTCTLNFYGDNAPAALTSASLAGGKVLTFLASTSAPNFQGYVIAVCNFQFGHGFAFVTKVGTVDVAMGYLALVIPDVPRSANPVSDLVAGNVNGEVLGQ